MCYIEKTMLKIKIYFSPKEQEGDGQRDVTLNYMRETI